MFFNFLNFFAIFLEFRISVWVRMDQNENFFFFTFSASPIPFFLEKKPYWCVWIFLLLFLNSLFRVGLEWIKTRIFFSHILSLSRPVLAWKEAILMFFNFSIFLLFFWNSLFRVRFEWIRTIIFFFLSFSASPVPSWLLNKPYWSFWIFLLYFQNSIFWIGLELAGTIFFFSHS